MSVVCNVVFTHEVKDLFKKGKEVGFLSEIKTPRKPTVTDLSDCVGYQLIDLLSLLKESFDDVTSIMKKISNGKTLSKNDEDFAENLFERFRESLINCYGEKATYRYRRIDRYREIGTFFVFFFWKLEYFPEFER